MRPRTLAVTGVAAAVVAVLAVRYLPADADAPRVASAPVSGGAPSPERGHAAFGPDAPVAPLPMPPHLRGVAVDGGVDLDAQGKPVFNRKLRNLFHHMIGMAEGDAGKLPGVRESLQAWMLEHALPPAAQSEVMAAFDRYVAFLEAASKVQLASHSPGDLERVYQTVALLRQQYLGPEMAEGFFAEQEAMDRYTVEQRRVLADGTLTAEQRRQRLEELEQQLPESLRKPFAPTRKIQRLEQETQSLRAAGASQEAIDTLRTERYGPEAAERFRALDQERAQWAQRLASYRAERDAIRADNSLAPEAQARAIDALVATRFSGTEALRVRGLGNN